MAAWLIPTFPKGLVLAAATAGAMLFICRFTIPAALAIAALQLAGITVYSSEESPAGLLPIMATAYFLARYVAGGGYGLLVGAVVLSCAMAGSVHDLQTAIYGSLLLGGPFAFGRAVRRRALAAERARAAAASLAQVDAAAMAEQAIADERGRLGGHALSVIRSSVEQMNEDAAAAANNLDPELMRRIADRGRAAVTELRRLLGLLRAEPELPPAGLQKRWPQPWRADAMTAVGVGLLSFLEAVVTGPPPANIVAWILPAVLPLPLAIRRRKPAVACLCVAVLMVISTIFSLPFSYGFVLGPMITFTVLAWSAGVAGRRTSWAGLCILLAAVAGRTYLIDPGSVPPILTMFALTAVAGQEWSRKDRDRRSAEDQGNNFAADLRADISRAVRSERLRIARELHDVTSHAVGVMVLQASAAQALYPRDPQAARQALENVEAAGQQALVELSELFRVLDAGAIGSPGLAAPSEETLEELTVRMRTAGLDVDLKDDALTVPEDLERSIYRTIQEALTNVARHAPGARATVTLSDEGKGILLAVTNSLPDIADPAVSAESTGFGLVGIRERLDSLGGTLRVSRSGGSFTLTAYFPVPDVPRS